MLCAAANPGARLISQGMKPAEIGTMIYAEASIYLELNTIQQPGSHISASSRDC